MQDLIEKQKRAAERRRHAKAVQRQINAEMKREGRATQAHSERCKAFARAGRGGFRT